MEQRKAGGIAVSALGLGCMGMSEFYGAVDDAQSLSTLDEAFDMGVTLFDTADTYGAGHNESLLGRFLQGKQGRAVVSSKCGIVRAAGSYARRIDNRPAYIRQACEASLQRLGVERIDLYFIHRLNRETPLEDALEALLRLREQGKIGGIGLSEVSAATLRRAAALAPIAAVQSEYSLWTRDPEREVLQACRDTGASFFAYSPLGRGFLTGSIDRGTPLDSQDARSFNPRFNGANLDANLRIVAALRALAADQACTPAQLALAWLLAQGGDIIPIPGTKRSAYLRENLGALALDLSAADLARIGAALPPGMAAGERYSEEGMKGLNM
ncbi:aldo/keto reductase [Massilia sp. NR 4-1]|uniref:aldo/keto reductase n=1 Tax=Massilia sp. NR 4-1 TaxID=1678028 RepID=UPI00067C905B|nr:aldo/keto reductase [Massilia sp. NR 4-1]AKU24377.1 aldo/keto reductase [Massilia sp. NR 4-1]